MLSLFPIFSSFINSDPQAVKSVFLQPMKPKTLSWILFIFLSLTWGSSFILMKKSMYPVSKDDLVLDPFQVGALRILIASLVLLPVALRHIKKLKRKHLPFLAVSGLAGNFFPAFLFTTAETHIDSSLAGLLNMSTAFFVTLLGILLYRTWPSKYQLAGLVIGSLGLYLVLSGEIDFASNDIGYALLIIIATVCYALSLTTIKFKLADLESIAITSFSFLLILLPALFATIYYDALDPVINHPDGFRALGFLGILSVVGTALAVVLFTRLISISSHIFSAAVAYMLPVVAIFLGVLVDGESFSPINLIWVLLIFTGVYLMNRR